MKLPIFACKLAGMEPEDQKTPRFGISGALAGLVAAIDRLTCPFLACELAGREWRICQLAPAAILEILIVSTGIDFTAGGPADFTSGFCQVRMNRSNEEGDSTFVAR